jgi:hypothetical protein
MAQCKITDKTQKGLFTNVSITARLTQYNLKYSIYAFIENIAGAFAAIEATSWAELAEIGEVYEHEQFTLEILED